MEASDEDTDKKVKGSDVKKREENVVSLQNDDSIESLDDEDLVQLYCDEELVIPQIRTLTTNVSMTQDDDKHMKSEVTSTRKATNKNVNVCSVEIKVETSNQKDSKQYEDAKVKSDGDISEESSKVDNLDQIVAASNSNIRARRRIVNTSGGSISDKSSYQSHAHHKPLQLPNKSIMSMRLPTRQKETHQMNNNNINSYKLDLSHNLASLPSWKANDLVRNSHYLCSKWDNLRLGIDAGSPALNEYLRTVQQLNDPKSNKHELIPSLTSTHVVQLIETLRPVSCKPPKGSPLYDLVIVGNEQQGEDGIDNQIMDDIVSDVDYDDDDDEDDENGNYKSEVEIKSLDSALKDDAQATKVGKTVGKNKQSTRSTKTRETYQYPWKSFTKVYQMICRQDSLDDGKQPLERRKIHYMEDFQVIDRLKSIENRGCELKVRSDAMMKKKRELGIGIPERKKKKKQKV